MCGIVGYIGLKQAQDILVNGLRKLEYRGYDSAGIAIHNGKLQVQKKQGKLENLSYVLEGNPLKGTVGIGHTRWATHGKPSDENSHPHMSQNKRFAVVHNGIIENYQELRDELKREGYQFQSETDTEVIAHLLDLMDTGDLFQTIQKVIMRLEGAYALGVISENEPEKLIAVRMASPLIVGVADDGNYIASDIPAILPHTKNMYILESGEIAILTSSEVTLVDFDGKKIAKKLTTIDWDLESAEKSGYDHFMLKEIAEQPRSLSNTLRGRIVPNDKRVQLNEIKMSAEDINKISRINIVACGTSYHAGLVGKEIIEQFTRIPVEVSIASEYRYRNPIVLDNELTIAISQSGETADTMAAMMEAKEKGSHIIGITNCVDSSIARESDDVLYTYAGPEIAVASTKAYTSQLMALNLLSLYFAQERKTLDGIEISDYVRHLMEIPQLVEEALKESGKVEEIANDFQKTENLFFLGRGMDAHATLEASLKLKEVSYIHSEAYAAGELKHGTLALITEGTPVISLSTQPSLNEKTISNIIEVKSRGAKTYGVGFADNLSLQKTVDVFLEIPNTIPEFTPLVSSIPLQMLAYYASIQRGNNPDRPRNLAKSVTVE